MFSFSKMQGAGNDFVVIDVMKNQFDYSLPVLSQFLCDRHYGVGADGLILIDKSETQDFKMRIFNADGSEAEMCGNGIRCLAKYAFEKGLTDKAQFFVETLAGTKKAELELEHKKVVSVKVNMGCPEIDCIKYMIEIEEKQYYVYPVSLGNPHAVCFVKDVENFEVEKIGAILENYKYFPNKTNVEFVEIVDQHKMKVRVWERGVGETNACGTGACASCMIAIKEKFTENDITVDLKGGSLKIYFDKESQEMFLEGEAEFVFDGKIEEM